MDIEDLGINPVTVVITLVAYGICMAALWKGVGGWLVKDQIIISVLALPILYFFVNMQMNK